MSTKTLQSKEQNYRFLVLSSYQIDNIDKFRHVDFNTLQLVTSSECRHFQRYEYEHEQVLL